MKNSFSHSMQSILQSAVWYLEAKARRLFSRETDTAEHPEDPGDKRVASRLGRRAVGLRASGRKRTALMRIKEIENGLERVRAIRQILFSEQEPGRGDVIGELLSCVDQSSNPSADVKEDVLEQLERSLVYARLGRNRDAARAFSTYLDVLEEFPSMVFLPDQLPALLYESGGFEGMDGQIDRLAELFFAGAQRQGILALEIFAQHTMADIFLLEREDLLEYYWNYIFDDDFAEYTLDGWMHQLFIPGILLCEYLDKAETATYWLERYLDLYEKRRAAVELSSPYIPLLFDYIRKNYPELLEGRDFKVPEEAGPENRSSQSSSAEEGEASETREESREGQRKREEASAFFHYSRMLLLMQLHRYKEAEELLTRLPRGYLEKFGTNIEEALQSRTAVTMSSLDFAAFLLRLVQTIAGARREYESQELDKLLNKILQHWLEKLLPLDRDLEPVLQHLSHIPELDSETRMALEFALSLFEPE